MNVLELANKRAAELEAELAEINAFKRTYAKFAPLAGDAQDAAIRQFTPAPPAHQAHKAPTKRQQVEDAVTAALAKEQPLTVPTLLQRLKEVGVDVGGTDVERNLSSYLSRSDRFQNRRKDGGWFLVGAGGEPPGGGNLPGAQ